MAENPSSSPLPPPTGGDQIPPNPNPRPQIPPSPSSSSLDLPQISSPHSLQRSGSVSRLTQLQQQQLTAAAIMRQYGGGGGGQMSFGGPQIRPGQQLPVLPGGQAAAHFNLPRQKAQLQAMGMMNSMGVNVNAQLRGNVSLSYAQQQQRFSNQVQMRQQQLLPQTSLPSPQKLPGPNLSRSSSLTSMNPQLSGLPPNGQSVLTQSTLVQQQWLKQVQPTMPATVSPSYSLQQQQQQRQQQAFLSQQLGPSQLHQKSMGLSHQQISQLVQHQSQYATSQQHLHQQQLQQLQQFQQQSPRIAGTAAQQSQSLTGSQPDTPASGATTTGGSFGTETGSRLRGKRKIQDLVSQVDSLGKLDPEVEDLLLEIADDFIDSVTTFACSIAKHRKSSTLDSKDLLLHLEKNWHLKIPGYTREEQMNQRISLSTDVHTKRLELVRALMDSQQLERQKNGATKGTVKQISGSLVVDRPIKPSPSSEHLVLHATASQMMQKIP